MEKQTKLNPVIRNLLMDTLIFIGVLVSFSPSLTGQSLHEWIGLAFGLTLIIHMLLHWNWIAAVTRRFFKATTWRARINYLLGAALFIAFITIIFSGVMESETVLQTFGLTASRGFFWKMLHSASADVTLWLTALHIGLHGRWILNAVKKLFTRRPKVQPSETLAVVPVHIDEQ